MKQIKRKAINGVLAGAFLIGILTPIMNVSAFSGAGDGTQMSPYKITNCAQLQDIADDTSAYYVLYNDIDCSSFDNYTPITSFSGTFDGLNHTISNLTINKDDLGSGAGIFGTTLQATIKNIETSNIVVTSQGSETGGLVGYAEESEISHAKVNASVIGVQKVGGLVGWSDFTTISKSSSSGDVSGDEAVGGFAGRISGGAVSDSYTRSSVDGTDNVGGFAGENSVTISRVYSAGEVNGSAPETTGGLIGLSSASYQKSYWDTEVSGQSNACGTDSDCSGSTGGGKTTAEMKDPVTFTGSGYGIDIANEGTYRYIKFEINQIWDGSQTDCSNGNVCTQVSELELLKDGVKVSYPDGTTAINPGGDNLGGNVASNLIDGDVNSKWLDGNFSFSNQSNGHSEVIIDSQTGVDINGYNWATGNDYVERDPYSWSISGSDDGSNYTVLDTQTNNRVTFNRNSFIAPQYAGWDFVSTWYRYDAFNDGYPELGLIGPQIQCEMVVATITSLHTACSILSDVGNDVGDTTWEMQYRRPSSSTWTNVNLADNTTLDDTISNLLSGIDYEIRFRYTSEFWGISHWGRIEATTLSAPDTDHDGISDTNEDAGPNSGDANNDGIPDKEQPNVTSLPNATNGKQALVESSCAIQNPASTGESSSAPDSIYSYPSGLLGFTLACGSQGATANVTLYFFGSYDIDKTTLRKWNNSTGIYTTIVGATLSNVTIGGQPALKIQYQLVDGGALDQDGIVDGNIVDPAGAGVTLARAPSTGLGGLNLTKLKQ